MDGESVKEITEEEDMPARSTIHNWLANNEKFRAEYEYAKEAQSDTFADEMDYIANDESIDVNRARLIIDTRKWIASKLKPKKYGDKVDHTSGGKPIPIVSLDVLRNNRNSQGSETE